MTSQTEIRKVTDRTLPYLPPVRWHTDPRTCPHANEHACPTCDHDGYYANTYPDCPWKEQ